MKAQGRPQSLPCRPQCWTSAEHPWDDVKWTVRATGRGDKESADTETIAMIIWTGQEKEMPGRQEQRPTEQVLSCFHVGSQGEALDLTKENRTEEPR